MGPNPNVTGRAWAVYDRVIDWLCNRTAPTTVRFTGPLTEGPCAPRPGAGAPQLTHPPRAAAGHGCPPLEPTRTRLEGDSPTDDRPPGAGLRADDCAFLDDPNHRCINREGDPVRAGQSCWHTARAQSLRTLAERHPRWAELLHEPPPDEVVDNAKAAYQQRQGVGS